MLKRTVAAILTAFLILPALITAGSVVFAPEMPFVSSSLFYAREIEEALGNINDVSSVDADSYALPEENRYIIKFSDGASDEAVADALESTQYTPLSEGGERIFAVSIGDADFTDKYADIIDYSECDNVRNTLAAVNDPGAMSAYGALGIYNAWDTVLGDSDIIVAVLDTGVSRSHEDLRDVNILAGYDAVSRKAGVYEDSSGHGTGVTGIIAAAANNSLGIAGVAHGVSILPVKVSASSTTIYSSDLVRGIRFAADAGAKIINMSVGGYSSSVAEQEAVNYALSKGCILISAAGNGGNSEYADQKSYPASYDGVISVASCNDEGEYSIFSQYNDAVDIAATGENITIPMLDDEGRSVYRTDSGTSYSCAFVSGIAALAASLIGDEARFESAEFEALLIDAFGNDRNDRLGLGMINAEKVVALADEPIVTGVIDGESYSESVTIGFNRGTATLGGDELDDGETIVANGTHTLVVTDGENEKRLTFRLDYTPLSYEFLEFSSYAYFEFERGSALLDGFPYDSGDRITASGRHEFVLTDGDEKLSRTINLRYALPSVYGVSDGETYQNPIEILIIGDGTATLDGESVYGAVTVAKSGSHTLKVQSGNGAVKAEYKFKIDFRNSKFVETDYANGKAAVDEENGYICLYGDTLVGVRLYDIDSPEKYLHFLPVGRVYGHVFYGDELLLFGDGGITVLDRATALDGPSAVKNTIDPPEISLYTYVDGYVIGFGNGNMYTVDIETGVPALFAELGYACEKVFYSDGYYYITAPSQNSLVRIYDIISGETAEYDIGYSFAGAPMCFGAGYLAIGNRLYSANSGNLVLEFASQKAVRIDNLLLYTDSGIIDIFTGREIGSFSFGVSDIVMGTERNYLFGITPQCAFVPRDAEGVNALGAAVNNDLAFSLPEQTTFYRNTVHYNTYSQPISVASSRSTFYVLFADRYALYRMNTSDNHELSPVALRYKPSSVICTGGYVVVCFADSPAIYIAPDNDASIGKYLTLTAVCTDAAVADGKVYAITGGKISVIDIVSGDVTAADIAAQDIVSDGTRLLTVNGNVLSAYSFGTAKLPLEFSVIANGELLAGNGIAMGRTVYDSENGAIITKTDSKIIAFKGNTVVTEKGVYDPIEGEYIGTTGIYSPKFVCISDDNSVIAVGSGLVSVNFCSEGDEVITAPNIRGIEPYEAYSSSTVITYDHGMGYLDGQLFESGSTADGIGSHIFSLSLPCGRNITVPFSIEAPLSGIEFLAGSKTMSVGETVALRVMYLPEGASSIPVTFNCDSDKLSISDTGEVTALAVGKYTVTATAKTESGRFSAKTEITVRDDILALAPESGMTIDRNNALMLGIVPGTKAPELLAMLATGKTASVLNADGDEVSGHVGTGHRIVLLDEQGSVTDELYAVVRGDTDGDGCITAYDMYELEHILKGYEYSTAFTAAADVNGNGVLADNDYRALKKMLFGRTESELGTPADSLFGSCTVQTVSRIESGDVIDVAVCISGSKYARGVFGSIAYDEGLEFVECISTGWDVNCYDHGNKIAFYAYDENGEICDTAFKVLVNLRFRVNAKPASIINLQSESLTVSFEDGCRNIRFQNAELQVVHRVYDNFQVHFMNADKFDFDSAVHDYSVKIPHNSAIADISVTHRADQKVTLSSLAIPDSGEETVVITYTDESGTTEFYNINVSRGEAPAIDTNCKLETLEVEGHKLTPVFDPDYRSYNITVPYGTEKINLYCVAQNPTATVIVGDTTLKGEKNAVVITVGAPDGETLTYTVNVTVLPKPEEPDANEAPIANEHENKGVPVWAIALIALIAVTATAVIVKVKRKVSESR